MTVQIAKTRISPSDLTFGWTGCRKCFWLKYRHGVSHQGPFPGIVDSAGKMLESTPIVVNGVQTPVLLGATRCL